MEAQGSLADFRARSLTCSMAFERSSVDSRWKKVSRLPSVSSCSSLMRWSCELNFSSLNLSNLHARAQKRRTQPWKRRFQFRRTLARGRNQSHRT